MSLYSSDSPPEDHISSLRADSRPLISKASYGIDSPLGLVMSNIAAPLYLYAAVKGKSEVWDNTLASLPVDLLSQPSLDVGCGRGLVLLKTAQRKKLLAGRGVDTKKAYGIDLFIKGDQTGNSPEATFDNAAATNVLDFVSLHTASFVDALPFCDGSFALVTASLSVHNVDKIGRKKAIREIMRVCRPGGKIIIIDLQGYVKELLSDIKAAGWADARSAWAGPKMMYGMWPCQILTATCPQ